MKIVDKHIHWYNKARIKKSLGWMSPLQYRRRINLQACYLRRSIYHCFMRILFSLYSAQIKRKTATETACQKEKWRAGRPIRGILQHENGKMKQKKKVKTAKR